MNEGYIQNKASCLQDILKLAMTELQEPGDSIGYTMPGGKYHIFVYVDDADDKLYVVEPNRVADGAHEPFVGDTYLAAYGDFANLMIGCQWCMDHFEMDALEQARTQPDKVTIPLGFANLVAERGSDPSYKELFVGLEDKDGVWLQDLAVIGGKYHYEKDEVVHDGDISVKVYSDKDNEDYTHDFTVGVFVPEREPTTWICVYKDALNFEDDDNLANICVPTDWLLKKLREEGETDIDGWFNEYTADNTDAIARQAYSEGIILACDDPQIPLPVRKEPLAAKITAAQEKQTAGKRSSERKEPDIAKGGSPSPVAHR